MVRVKVAIIERKRRSRIAKGHKRAYFYLPEAMDRALREAAKRNERDISAQARIYIERGLATDTKP